MPKTPEEAGFLAGAALHLLACHDHPIGGLWRQRGRARAPCRAYRQGDDPGPAGRLLQAWRRLAERDPLEKAVRLMLRPKDWMVDLTNVLEVPLDAALEDVGDAARKWAVGEGSGIAAPAAVAAVSLQKRPDAATLALADAVLAHRLKWPAPVPLIAGQIRRSDLRAATSVSWSTAIQPAASGCVVRMARKTNPCSCEEGARALLHFQRWIERVDELYMGDSSRRARWLVSGR